MHKSDAAPHQCRHGPWWWKAFQPTKNVFSSVSFWLFSLWAWIWQPNKLKASIGILLCMCLILSSSPSKVCARLFYLPEQPCMIYRFILKKLHWQTVSKTRWFLHTGMAPGKSWILVWCSMQFQMLRTSVGQIYPFGRDIIENEFALPPPRFISVDFFSRGRSRDQPSCLIACLALFSGWLSHERLGSWGKCLGYSPSLMIAGLAPAGPNPFCSISEKQSSEVWLSMDDQVLKLFCFC